MSVKRGELYYGKFTNVFNNRFINIFNNAHTRSDNGAYSLHNVAVDNLLGVRRNFDYKHKFYVQLQGGWITMQPRDTGTKITTENAVPKFTDTLPLIAVTAGVDLWSKAELYVAYRHGFGLADNANTGSAPEGIAPSLDVFLVGIAAKFLSL